MLRRDKVCSGPGTAQTTNPAETVMAKKMTDMDGLLESWMESQHKLWDGWMQTVQQVSGGNPMAETWQQGLARWREAVDQTLETQKQATRAWAEQVAGVEGAPEELKRWAQEGVTLVDQWSDAQHGLWKQWFDLMSSAAPAGGAAPAAEQMRELMAGWEQASERMQELQRQWASSFAAFSPGKK
jgi:hypothetical protein